MGDVFHGIQIGRMIHNEGFWRCQKNLDTICIPITGYTSQSQVYVTEVPVVEHREMVAREGIEPPTRGFSEAKAPNHKQPKKA